MKYYIILFDKQIPLYGLFFYLGILLSAMLALLLCRRRRIDWFDLAGAGVYAMIGAMLGAKLLFVAVSWREILHYQIGFVGILKGGFVFFGGLLGGSLGLWIYTRQFKMCFGAFADLFAAVLPLGHAFGRVGCFFAGCCYGIPFKSPISVVYTEVPGTTPTGIPLLPIQLIEAAALLLLFAGLVWAYLRLRLPKGQLALWYVICYSVLRFLLEFFRGDLERGILLLSTSQWICCLLLLLGCMMLKMRSAQQRQN